MSEPKLIKPIPPQMVNEQAAYGPFDLKEFIQSDDGGAIIFSADLSTGQALPAGMICTADGTLTGIPAKGTEGVYEVVIAAENASGTLETRMVLTIKPVLTESTNIYFDQLKAQVWEAIEKNLPVGDLNSILDRPVTPLDIYYLLERWGVLKIWDAFNLDPPGEFHILNLEGASPHYYVFDRGSCLVACPKSLFSHERTFLDTLQTARAMAQEVYKRGWTVELVGLNKVIRATWIEIQRLIEVHGKPLEVINFNPMPEDLKLYASQVKGIGMGLE